MMLAETLEEIRKRYEWPFEGGPGGNPDYLDSEENAAMKEAIRLLPRSKELPRGLLIIFFTTLITCWVIYFLPGG